VVAAVPALAANRQQSQSTLVARAEADKAFYPKFAEDAVKNGIWTPGKKGDPTVEENTKVRAGYITTARTRGRTQSSPSFKT